MSTTTKQNLEPYFPSWMGAYPRANAPWEDAEIQMLMLAHKARDSVETIMKRHGRTRTSIECRLDKHCGTNYALLREVQRDKGNTAKGFVSVFPFGPIGSFSIIGRQAGKQAQADFSNKVGTVGSLLSDSYWANPENFKATATATAKSIRHEFVEGQRVFHNNKIVTIIPTPQHKTTFSDYIWIATAMGNTLCVHKAEVKLLPNNQL